jgi:hypothetical protein
MLGRRLTTLGNPNRILTGEYYAEQGAYEATQNVALGALPHALPEIVYTMVASLYELFGFFKLPNVWSRRSWPRYSGIVSRDGTLKVWVGNTPYESKIAAERAACSDGRL